MTLKTAFVSFALPALASAQSSNLKGALNKLENTSSAALLLSSAFFLITGLLLFGIGAFIYFKKIKGAYKPTAAMKAVAFGLGGLGLISFLAGILSLAMFLLFPPLIHGLTAPG